MRREKKKNGIRTESRMEYFISVNNKRVLNENEKYKHRGNASKGL